MYGQSDFSPLNTDGQKAETVPAQMSAPKRSDSTTLTTLAIEFEELTGTQRGGESLNIVTYNLQVYSDSTGWTDVQGAESSPTTLLTYTQSSTGG